MRYKLLNRDSVLNVLKMLYEKYLAEESQDSFENMYYKILACTLDTLHMSLEQLSYIELDLQEIDGF